MKSSEFFHKARVPIALVIAAGNLLVAACTGDESGGASSPPQASAAAPAPASAGEQALAQAIIDAYVQANPPEGRSNPSPGTIEVSIPLREKTLLGLRERSSSTQPNGTPVATTVNSLAAVVGPENAQSPDTSIELTRVGSDDWKAAWDQHGRTGSADSVRDPARFEEVAQDMEHLTQTPPGGAVPSLEFPS